MGLSLIVGILTDLKGVDDEGADYFRGQFDAVNRALKAENLPPHQEPESLETTYSGDMSGYSAIHHLRQIAARTWAGQKLPDSEEDEPTKDPAVEKYNKSVDDRRPSLLSRVLGRSPNPSFRYDHLMFHSDAEGFYLPQDFSGVLFPNPRLKIAGGMIGSTVRLQKECLALARLLGLPPGLDPDSDEVQGAMDDPEPGGPLWKAHGTATHACLRLLEACSFSLAHQSAIVFA